MQGPRRLPDTQVLVIGNGPAGLALSAFLSGVQPFYCGSHKNQLINESLSANPDISLLDQDLSWVDSLNELSSSGRPLSVLYDMLVRPGADMGKQEPSCIQWEMNPAREVSHMVVGETPIGGSWNNYDSEMLAVSFAQWLDLPGYSIEDWLGGTPLIPRLPSLAVVSYMQCYAEQLGIARNFHTGVKIISVTKCDDLWLTEGRYDDGRIFSAYSRAVVLACGKTAAKKLGLQGESQCKNIVYDVPTFKERVDVDEKLAKCYTMPSTSGGDERVVVVGDGISAADVVRDCLERGIAVTHLIRRNDRQLRNVMMSRLSATHYGEYAEVYRLMIGRKSHHLYERITSATISEVHPTYVIVATPKGVQQVPYALLSVCIGRSSDFDGALHGKYSFSAYRSEQDPTLLSCGSFAGDHFVRFLVGGCLQVARDITRLFNNNNNDAKLCCGDSIF